MPTKNLLACIKLTCLLKHIFFMAVLCFQWSSVRASDFYFKPSFSDISERNDDLKYFYQGQWYSKTTFDKNLYSDGESWLEIKQGGDLVTWNLNKNIGVIPLIYGGRDFSITVVFKLKDYSSDAWPAIWMMPYEHNRSENDRVPYGDGSRQEWIEIDIHEGGFSDSGVFGTFHRWSGNWPNYKRESQLVNCLKDILPGFLDFQKISIKFNHTAKKISWSLDDRYCAEVDVADSINVMERQNFYLIFGSQSHGKFKPYSLLLKSINIHTADE